MCKRLAIKMMETRRIQGKEVTQLEHKLSQFDDDTSLISDGREIFLVKLWENWIGMLNYLG